MSNLLLPGQHCFRCSVCFQRIQEKLLYFEKRNLQPSLCSPETGMRGYNSLLGIVEERIGLLETCSEAAIKAQVIFQRCYVTF